MDPVALRLLNQQLASPKFQTPDEVVNYMCAVQAQDYRMMRWAVAMRTRNPSSRAFTRAFDEGRMIRLHLMRGTWQLVSAANYGWLLDLCAPKAIAAIKGWMRSNGISISDEELADVREVIVGTAESKRSATKEDFVQALAERDLFLEDRRLSYHICLAEMTGVICSGDLLPMKSTYALTARKVQPMAPVDREEALVRIARMYFRSRQPATLEDFVWWSGLSVGDCRRAIALLGDYLHSELFEGREFYLADEGRTRGFRRGKYLLIPPYDEYLISYKSRDVVLAPAYRHKAHNAYGIFHPVIARAGEICGNWAPYKKSLQASFFLGAPHGDLEEAWGVYRGFLAG